MLVGARELRAHDRGLESAEHEEDERRHEVALADRLVVDGGEPPDRARRVSQIASSRSAVRRRCIAGARVRHATAGRSSFQRFEIREQRLQVGAIEMQSGMSLPGLIACGLAIHPQIAACVRQRAGGDLSRLARCVRSGPIRRRASCREWCGTASTPSLKTRHAPRAPMSVGVGGRCALLREPRVELRRGSAITCMRHVRVLHPAVLGALSAIGAGRVRAGSTNVFVCPGMRSVFPGSRGTQKLWIDVARVARASSTGSPTGT